MFDATIDPASKARKEFRELRDVLQLRVQQDQHLLLQLVEFVMIASSIVFHF